MMCFGDPAKSLSIARSRLTPEQWTRFERDFDDFCVVQGMHAKTLVGVGSGSTVDWARWAFFQGRGYSDRTADQRVADAKYTRLAIAMMSDEQALASLERWKEGK